jgi:hypothetical protein
MLAQVLQRFFGKEHLVKNWLISTLGKVIYFKGTIYNFSVVYETSLQFTKEGGDQLKKIIPCFNMRLLVLRFLWIYVCSSEAIHFNEREKICGTI